MDMRDTIVRGGGGSAIKVAKEPTIEYLFQDVVFEAWDGFFGSDTAVTFIEGQTYTVTINGVDYTTTGRIATDGGQSFVVLGNIYLAGVGDDTGEPFVMISIPDVGTNLVMPDLVDMESVTVSISTDSYNEYLALNIGKYSLAMPNTYDPNECIFGPYIVKEANGKFDGSSSRTLFEGVTLNNWETLLPIGGFMSAAYSIDGSVYSDRRVGISRDETGYYLWAPSGSGSVTVCTFEEEHNYSFLMTGQGLGYADDDWYEKFTRDGFEFSIILNELPVITPLDPKYIQLTSPNGTKYSLSVSDDGELSAVPIA